jgi:hypothetical protein
MRLPYPQAEPSLLIGPVARGTAEPSIGCVIDFSLNPGQGRAGIGLARDSENSDSYLALTIDSEKDFIMNGQALGLPQETTPLPEPLRQAMAAGGHRIGLTAKIAADALQVTLRAKDPAADQPVEFTASWPITAAERERLLSRPLAILAHQGRHRLTPYLDDGRRPDPDLSIPASADYWRNPGGRQLRALCRAGWLLGRYAPLSLLDLKGAMLAAADKDADAQHAAVESFNQNLPQVLKDTAACAEAPPESVRAATAELSGYLPPASNEPAAAPSPAPPAAETRQP